MVASAGNLDDNNCDYVTIDFGFTQFALMSDLPTPHGLYPPRTARQTEGGPVRRLPANCLISVDAGAYFSLQILLMTPLINKSYHLYDFDTVQLVTNSTTIEIFETKWAIMPSGLIEEHDQRWPVYIT